MLFDISPKVERRDFYDREAELGEIEQAVRLGEGLIVVYGVRRIGKTSAVRVALSELKAPYAFVDVREIYFSEGAISDSRLVKHLVNSFRSNMKLYQRVGFDLKSALGRVKSIHVEGLEVEFASRPEIRFTDILRHIDDWCVDHEMRFIIVFDEAQYLRFSNVRYDGVLAWAVDNLPSITFILTGSEVGVLRDFLKFEDPRAPLYGRYRREVRLERFSEETSMGFLKAGFEELGVTVSDVEVEEAVDRLDGVVGWLTYYGYYRAVRRLPHGEALGKVFEEGSRLVISEIERLIAPSRSRYLAILEAVARGASSFTSIKAFVYARVRPISNERLSELLKKLVKYGYLEKRNGKYLIPDPVVRQALTAV